MDPDPEGEPVINRTFRIWILTILSKTVFHEILMFLSVAILPLNMQQSECESSQFKEGIYDFKKFKGRKNLRVGSRSGRRIRI